MQGKLNKLLLFGSFYSFFVTGVIVLMTGAILPYLLTDFKLSYNMGGLLLSLQAVGNLLAGVVSGFVCVYLGRRAMLILGAAAFIIGFGGIALVSSSLLLFVFIFISGLGWGIFNNLVNNLISEASDGKGSVINLLHVFFAVGAFTGPIIVSGTILAGLDWRVTVGAAAALSVILIPVFATMPLPAVKQRDKTEDGKISFDFFRHARYFLFMAILFFYVGTENSVNGWAVTYLVDAGLLSDTFAQNILSTLWIAIIAGRLLCAFLSKYVAKEKILLSCGAGTIIFFFIFIFAKSPLLIAVSMFGLGLSFSGVYPTTVANASYLTNGSSISNGLLLSCGGLGASVVPYIVGVSAQSGGISLGMLSIGFSAAVLFVSVIVNLYMSNRKKEAAAHG